MDVAEFGEQVQQCKVHGKRHAADDEVTEKLGRKVAFFGGEGSNRVHGIWGWKLPNAGMSGSELAIYFDRIALANKGCARPYVTQYMLLVPEIEVT